MTAVDDGGLDEMLVGLHKISDDQFPTIMSDYEQMKASGDGLDQGHFKAYLRDKLVALDREKSQFCYQMCRAISARRVVEAGTSYGVSTMYLAAAMRANLDGLATGGIVIGTEYEPNKVKAARDNFRRAGLNRYIDLREGDLRETLRDIEGPIDFMLIDIWIEMARPALELVYPHLRKGAVVLCDNTEEHRDDYADYFAFIHDPANGFQTMTLPFKGGLEMSVRS